MSICAALGYRWDGQRSKLYFQTREGSYNTPSLVQFLKDLKRELRGPKAVLVWDGLPAHKSREMKAYLAQQRDWLGGREITWLRARSEPRRDAVGKHQRARTGQPLRS